MDPPVTVAPMTAHWPDILALYKRLLVLFTNKLKALFGRFMAVTSTKLLYSMSARNFLEIEFVNTRRQF